MNESLPTTMHRIIWLMDRKADQIVKEEFGISLSWIRLLSVVSSNISMTQHKLAQLLDHSDAAVSRMLTKVSQADLVVISIDPQHLRKRQVSITPHGKGILTLALKRLNDQFTKDLNEARIDVDVFSKINTALEMQLVKTKNER